MFTGTHAHTHKPHTSRFIRHHSCKPTHLVRRVTHAKLGQSLVACTNAGIELLLHGAVLGRQQQLLDTTDCHPLCTGWNHGPRPFLALRLFHAVGEGRGKQWARVASSALSRWRGWCWRSSRASKAAYQRGHAAYCGCVHGELHQPLSELLELAIRGVRASEYHVVLAAPHAPGQRALPRCEGE